MTTRTIAELVFRIWGVMLLAQAAMLLPALVGVLAGRGESSVEAGLLFGSRLSYIATILIQIALASFVYVQAPLLAAWVARDDRHTSLKIDVRTLYVVALSLFGLTLMVDGVQELGVTLYTWFSIRNEAVDTVTIVMERRWESIVRASIELVIGAALFAGREAMARGWRSLRGMEA